jgi:hypothetical protein
MSALLLATVFGARGEACVASDSQIMMFTIRLVVKVLNYTDKYTYFLQIIFSQLKVFARAAREGSKTPPRRRRTRWRVDSFWML